MKRFCDYSGAILLLMALVVANPGTSAGWNIGLTLNPWETDPQKQDTYFIYNNTGVRVFVYHDRTGMKYTLEPGESGYPAIGDENLKFNPREIRCGFANSYGDCVVRLAPFGLTPVLVLDAAGCSPTYYMPQGTAASQEPPRAQVRYENRPIKPVQSGAVVHRNAAYRVERPSGRSGEAEVPAAGPQESQNNLRAGDRMQEGDPTLLLKTYMERMVHIYHRSRGEDRERQIADLKHGCESMLGRLFSEDLRSQIEKYEAVCRCIGDRVASGMSLDDIFKSKRCSDRSTKDLRSEIVSGFKQRIKR